MKTNKLWWSLLVALLLPLSFTLTACGDDDDDDDKGGSGSGNLAHTAWIGDAGPRDFVIVFYEEEFDAYSTDGYYGYSGQYEAKNGKIKLSYVQGSDNDLQDGTYKYKVSGRKGDREMEIYDLLLGGKGGDLYLEEVEVPDEMWE